MHNKLLVVALVLAVAASCQGRPKWSNVPRDAHSGDDQHHEARYASPVHEVTYGSRSTGRAAAPHKSTTSPLTERHADSTAFGGVHDVHDVHDDHDDHHFDQHGSETSGAQQSTRYGGAMGGASTFNRYGQRDITPEHSGFNRDSQYGSSGYNRDSQFGGSGFNRDSQYGGSGFNRDSQYGGSGFNRNGRYGGITATAAPTGSSGFGRYGQQHGATSTGSATGLSREDRFGVTRDERREEQHHQQQGMTSMKRQGAAEQMERDSRHAERHAEPALSERNRPAVATQTGRHEGEPRRNHQANDDEYGSRRF